MTRSALSLVVVALLLNACSDPQPPQQPEQPVAEIPAPQPDQPVTEPEDESDGGVQSGQAIIYRCDDGTEFELTIMGSSAHMELDNTSYELRQQPAASGIFHAGDLWQVHSKAETALLIGPDSTRECDQVATREVDVPAADPAEPAASSAEDAEQGVE
ncbi:MAG: MliC family protein [Alcanivoracaceae bacterium]|nr:MliC family protein [Alcanivoracaceae bacterium]